MASLNFTDFYISYRGNPNFREFELIEDDLLRVIVQKWEMILFTTKGEVFGEPNLGADLSYYLHETKLSAESVKESLNDQISFFMPEINEIDFTLDVEILEDPERYQEYMEIRFAIKDIEVYIIVS
jgi:hypothetical protein